jgi:hypothetical protein
MPDDFQSVDVPGYGTFNFPKSFTREQMAPLIEGRVKQLGQPQTGLAPQPSPETAGQHGNPILIQKQKGFVDTAKEEVGKGAEQMKKAVTEPGIMPTAVPQLLSGFMQIVGAPITAAGAKIEEMAPSLKTAQQQGQLLPLESPADVMGTALSLAGGRVGAGKPPAVPEESSLFRKLLSPGTVSPEAQRGQTLLRTATGTAAQDTAQTQAALRQSERQINALQPQQQLGLLNYIETRSQGARVPDPKLQGFADQFRDAMNLRRQKIEASPRTHNANLLEDYVTHYWTDPVKARVFVNNWMGKQGSSRSLKKRVIPTIAEGIQAGLQPVTTNPIDIALRYTASMDRYIAMNEMLEAGKQAGDVKFFSPGSKHIPEGWVPLEGHIPQRQTPVGQMQAHAPEDWARIWNNHIHQGIGGDWRDAYNAFRLASNTITQTVLGFSGFHHIAMAKHAIHSEFARALSQIVGGAKTVAKGAWKRDGAEILRGGTMLGKGVVGHATALAAPITRAFGTGRKLQQVYLGRVPGSPDFRRLSKLYAEAGGRGTGKAHAIDYEFSRAGSYFSAWRRRSLKHEMRQGLREIGEAKRPVLKGALFVIDSIGRVMDSFTEPLFKHYIPLLKNGIWADTMRAWLEANPHASYDEQLAVASKIVDSVDNRLGEMINDNIMWKTTAKQVASIGMLSYSWNIGKIREILGGMQAGAKTFGKGLDIASADYDPRVAYVVAFPMAVATVNAIYQYLKTGKPPESPHDLMAPRTGGMVPGSGKQGRSTPVPETALLPGDEKEIFGWYNMLAGNTPISQEIYNKANPLIRTGIDLMRKQDWKDQPFVHPDPTAPQWLKDYFDHVVGGVDPISVQRFMQGEKRGSHMSWPEEALGIRQSPQYVQDPEGYERTMKAVRERKWKDKERGERNLQRQYGGPQE